MLTRDRILDHHVHPTLIERLGRFPREPNVVWRGARAIIAILLRTWLRFYHRLRIVGLENLPTDGSFVIVSNHASHLDTLCLLAALPLSKLNRAFPAAAADYFFVSAPCCAVAVLAVNALPFARGAHVRQSIGLCRHVLANDGNVLILYPEGTRSTDGRVGIFRPGIGMLLAGSDTPVVPCYLDGAGRAMAKGCWFPRPRTIRLVVGRPRSFAAMATDKAGIHFVCRELERAVRGLACGASVLREAASEKPERHPHVLRRIWRLGKRKRHILRST